ncbi:G patch domain-containing protein 1-like isoform X2 [Argopecten irradians]|uniref:G patch domain-containing protein 1-like isoform X2 n=1 Tax=Argopecten irradians TaxID=31199 RepID=UPI00371C2B2D
MIDAYEEVISGHMTEWDRGHEKEEFIRASKLYKPLPGMMASRFTSAKYDDGTDTVDIPRDEGGDKTDQMKAAEMKMYGQLTHEEFEWHPHKLLCWRFNVPNPYAGSSVVGLPTVKREKYSVFNFLNFSNEPTASPNSEEMKALPAPDCPTGSKPVTFDIKNRSKMSAPLKSVFSDLMDAPASKPRPSDTEESITSTPQSTEQTEKPEQDLFNAIFGNTDSESEEDENNEGEKEEEEDDDNQSKSLNEPIQHNIDELTKHLPTSIQENVNLSESTEEKGIQERLNPPPQPPSPPEVEEEQYGPALPPPGASSTSSTAYVDLTSSSSRKYRHKDRHKDRHREKHKHKKEKKAKHKKDKHKEKKKSKKHRRRSDSSDSDSSDLEDDKELFQKLKAATQKGLLRNSDLI